MAINNFAIYLLGPHLHDDVIAFATFVIDDWPYLSIVAIYKTNKDNKYLFRYTDKRTRDAFKPSEEKVSKLIKEYLNKFIIIDGERWIIHDYH